MMLQLRYFLTFVLIAIVKLLSASIWTFSHSLPIPHWCCVAEGIAWTPIDSHALKTGMGARAGGLETSCKQKKSYIYVSPSKVRHYGREGRTNKRAGGRWSAVKYHSPNKTAAIFTRSVCLLAAPVLSITPVDSLPPQGELWWGPNLICGHDPRRRSRCCFHLPWGRSFINKVRGQLLRVSHEDGGYFV